MKYKKLTFILPTLVFCLCGCSSSINNSLNNSQVYYAEFKEYYNIKTDMFKGLEMYAWKDDEQWFTGLLPGTNRLKSVDEIKELQENPCPLEIMKDIFATYTENDCYYCGVFIVSTPPKESELDHSQENINNNIEDYKYICDYFNIHYYI